MLESVISQKNCGYFLVGLETETWFLDVLIVAKLSLLLDSLSQHGRESCVIPIFELIVAHMHL